MIAVIVFIVILGTLVFVHEAGHFFVARRNGIACEEFGIGFPPRIAGFFKDKKGKRRWVFGNKKIEEAIKEKDETVYSLNLIPIGGFVRIKGEDGEDKNARDSFASQSIFVRFKVLFAGVAMNFIVGALFFGFAFYLGLPEAIGDEDVAPNAKVQISVVAKDSPASKAKLQVGDTIVSTLENGKEKDVSKVSNIRTATEEKGGQNIELKILHPGEDDPVVVSVFVRKKENTPEGQGAIGIELLRTSFAKYGFFQSMWMGVETTGRIVVAIFQFLGDLIVRLFTPKPMVADVAGPVGIAVMTGQVAKMGLAFTLQFVAMLSVNLAVINLLPLPALDGGRILFLIIEKIKGKPVSEKFEGIVHTAGFIFLMSLMILVTIKDFKTFEIIQKIKDLF
ncbi:RIP metalloprotease RseP [bacterium]|jgi:regulator of sigma E protease|nr:RIP metalloprotease RseP [bacterium]MBT4250876.1 RIP metalloprotease RseP [bacterium]MBT4597589.1 RIP metalloprotease RseP [bacterium]MBT6754054.1 RIP metalloprotease RseP [bacterium]MBT7038084.1 RIP metalloprotease RseP [bacterium]